MSKELIDKIITYNYNEFGNEFGDCIVDMKQEIENLKNIVSSVKEDFLNANSETIELKSRIDKAIEITKTYSNMLDTKGVLLYSNLLNVLQGSDKE